MTNKMETKPRELWIGKYGNVFSHPAQSDEPLDHYIEKSAFDRLLAAAEKLVRALDRAVEVMEFAYMNAPEQPREIKEAREALAAYEAVGEEFDPTPWCATCGAMKPSKCDCGPIAENE